MARPTVIKPDMARQVEKLASINCSWSEIAAVLGVSEKTARNHFYQEYLKGYELGKTKLRNSMFDAAMSGNIVMMIWLSKQILGYSEKVESKVTDNSKVTFTIGWQDEINDKKNPSPNESKDAGSKEDIPIPEKI